MANSRAVRSKRTEGELLGLLRQRHNDKAGNGEAYAFMTGVRSAAGFDARRTLDAIAMSLWPSRGLLLDGFEVKCSRSDWLREMREPAKAEEFTCKIDRMWLVVADGSIVADGELPPGWGLLVAEGKRLVQRAAAQMLRPGPARGRPLPEAFDRSFVAALLREACRVGAATPNDVRVAREEAEAQAAARWKDTADRAKKSEQELRELVQTFERAAGIHIRSFGWQGRSPEAVGVAMRAVLDGDVKAEVLERRLRRVADDAEKIAEHARDQLAEFGMADRG